MNTSVSVVPGSIFRRDSWGTQPPVIFVGGEPLPEPQIVSPSSSILSSHPLGGGQSRCRPVSLMVTALLLVMSTERSWPSTLRPPKSSVLHTLGMVGVGTRVGAAAVEALVGVMAGVGAAGVVALGEGVMPGVTDGEGNPVRVGVGVRVEVGDGPRVAVLVGVGVRVDVGEGPKVEVGEAVGV